MTTVLDAAKTAAAARTVALASVALALETDLSRVEDAKQAYEGGLAAELGKWPSWIAFAEHIGVKAEHLNHGEDETKAFRRVLDVIMDKVIRDAWSSQKIKNLVEESKALVAQGKDAEAKEVDRQVQSARTRRTELSNVIKYGAVVGRYALDRMTQERELASVHKASVWASVFSQCNRHCEAARKAGAVITREDLLSIAAAVLDGEAKPERTDAQKEAAAVAKLWAALNKVIDLHLIADKDVRLIKNALNRGDRTQEEATEVEASIQPVTPRVNGTPKPAATAAAPKGNGKGKADKPGAKLSKADLKTAADNLRLAAAVEAPTAPPADQAKVAADVI